VRGTQLGLDQAQDVVPAEKAFRAIQRAAGDVWIEGLMFL